MKLEIELDLNKIDYEAINQQIQSKIADMDLETSYGISSKIDHQIKEGVQKEVNSYFRNGAWSGLSNDSKREIKDEISKNIKELISPHIENIFSQIPQEELNAIISDLTPKILFIMLHDYMRVCVSSFYTSMHDEIVQTCDDRIRSILSQ